MRFPRSAIGDMQAQFAVASIGEHRLGALFDRYGRDTVEAAAEEIFRQSEQLDPEAIRAIPDGVYTADGFLDSDGVGDDPVRMKVNITVEGERLVFDLTPKVGIPNAFSMEPRRSVWSRPSWQESWRPTLSSSGESRRSPTSIRLSRIRVASRSASARRRSIPTRLLRS